MNNPPSHSCDSLLELPQMARYLWIKEHENPQIWGVSAIKSLGEAITGAMFIPNFVSKNIYIYIYLLYIILYNIIYIILYII